MAVTQLQVYEKSFSSNGNNVADAWISALVSVAATWRVGEDSGPVDLFSERRREQFVPTYMSDIWIRFVLDIQGTEHHCNFSVNRTPGPNCNPDLNHRYTWWPSKAVTQ